MTTHSTISNQATDRHDSVDVMHRRNVATPLVAPSNSLEQQCALLWRSMLRVEPVGVQDDIFDLGGDSKLVDQMIANIGKITGRSLRVAEFMEKPTVAHLAHLIQQTRWAPSWKSLVPIQPRGTRLPLFFVHAPRGDVLLYCHIARQLGEDQPVYGLQAVGVDGDDTPLFSFEEMAAHYVSEMRAIQPEGPYSLCGFCLGGMLAFEVARQLHAQGCTVDLLALCDTYPPRPALTTKRQRIGNRVARPGRRLVRHFGQVSKLDTAQGKIAYLRKRVRNIRLTTKMWLWNRVYSHYQRRGRPLPRVFQNVYMINVRAKQEYEPSAYSGHVTVLLNASTSKHGPAMEDAWCELVAGGVEMHWLACNHDDMLKGPGGHEIAMVLKECVERNETSY